LKLIKYNVNCFRREFIFDVSSLDKFFSGTIDGYAGFVVMTTSSSNWSLLSLDEPRLTADTNLFFETFFFFFPLKFRLWSNLQLPNQIQFKKLDGPTFSQV
jgi:hypothetical protein